MAALNTLTAVALGGALTITIPRVLPVCAGTRVRFQNMDRVYHNAFSISPAMKFDIGKYHQRTP